MIFGHIISIYFILYFFENMISMANIKSMPGYGYKRDLGLGCRLLRGPKQNCGHQCRLLQRKKLLWVPPLNLKKTRT
jgi:hypothetical protein